MNTHIQIHTVAPRTCAGHLFAALILAGLLSGPLAHAALYYEQLKSIGPASVEGASPFGQLQEGTDGALYGTTYDPFVPEANVVFRVSKDGSGYALLHRFGGDTSDGANAFAGVTEGSDGMLFGTTWRGGTNRAGSNGGALGGGTVFRLNKDGSGYTLLHHFGGANDGLNPQAALVEASDGNLYGATRAGSSGSTNSGTVFRLNKHGGDYAILHSFSGTDGRTPNNLRLGTDGMLYGTTERGGSSNAMAGVVFKLNTSGGGYEVLHHFGGPGDGAVPRGQLLEATDGALYGTTDLGGSNNAGTIFKLNKDGGGYALLRSFSTNGADGLNPQAGSLEGPDGALYGTAASGGVNGGGTIFRLDKDGSDYSSLYHFANSVGDGQSPKAMTRGTDGTLYGTTSGGGEQGLGTVFKLSWPVVITRYERSGSTAQLGWNGVPNWPYRIQARTNLVASEDSWVDVGTNITALDGTFLLTVPEPPISPARFYRIAWP
jgi:uncharacterized repeat protein (TIGR03803 family)